jgi:Serine/threonine protein kinase
MNPDNSDDSDRYEIVAELGRGGLGVVLLARHVALDRLVAIKRVAGAFAIDPDARARLRREAQALGRLDHPNIVHVYDFVSSGDEGLIIMEYVQGESLDRLMAQDLVPTAAATSILVDVAAALTHAHERGVVHRDVKPSNVIVAPDGQAKLTDFGLARLLTSSSALRTRPGTVMGTPEYMAPEQILGEETDERTDAYAFAAMAYALLTRRPVFDRSDRRALLDAHLLERRYHQRTSSPDFRRPRRMPSSQGSRKRLHSAR